MRKHDFGYFFHEGVSNLFRSKSLLLMKRRKCFAPSRVTMSPSTEFKFLILFWLKLPFLLNVISQTDFFPIKQLT